MTKATRSLRISRIYTTHALRRLISLPEKLADLIEKHALRQ